VICYHSLNLAVQVGDHVRFKTDWLFWRGWQDGRVEYVPGLSPPHPQLEFNGLCWVCIRAADLQLAVLVNPYALCGAVTMASARPPQTLIFSQITERLQAFGARRAALKLMPAAPDRPAVVLRYTIF
jgi:hypothetical protein